MASMPAGIVVPAAVPINALLGQLAQVGAARSAGPACTQCGQTFADFKNTGLLGCPACYEAFAATVSPTIARSQGGATQHVGRAPARTGAEVPRSALLAKLNRELDEALATEQYERAARLRDRIRDMRPRAGGAEEGTPQ